MAKCIYYPTYINCTFFQAMYYICWFGRMNLTFMKLFSMHSPFLVFISIWISKREHAIYHKSAFRIHEYYKKLLYLFVIFCEVIEKKQSEKIKRVSLIHRYYNIITSKCMSFSIWYHITWFCSKLWNAALSGSLVYSCGCYTNIKGIVSILNKYLIKKIVHLLKGVIVLLISKYC